MVSHPTIFPNASRSNWAPHTLQLLSSELYEATVQPHFLQRQRVFHGLIGREYDSSKSFFGSEWVQVKLAEEKWTVTMNAAAVVLHESISKLILFSVSCQYIYHLVFGIMCNGNRRWKSATLPLDRLQFCRSIPLYVPADDHGLKTCFIRLNSHMIILHDIVIKTYELDYKAMGVEVSSISILIFITGRFS